MKFAKRLREECIVEWEGKYISYKMLKKLIKQMKLNATHKISMGDDEDCLYAPITEASPMLRHESIGDVFFDTIHNEFAKVNDFFLHKQKDLQSYYSKLTEAALLALKEKSDVKTLGRHRIAFREFYRSLCMLQNYVEMNYTGFVKIVKKYDKCMHTKYKERYLDIIRDQPFYRSAIWKEMMESVEDLYLKVFQIDKRSEAKIQLQPGRLVDTTTRHVLKLGIGIGVSLALFCASVIILFNCSNMTHSNWEHFIAVIPVYRAVGIPLIAVWLWGINVYIWTRTRINYIFIFGLDSRSSLDYNRIFKSAAILTTVWIISFFLFIGTATEKFKVFSLNAEAYPLMLVVVVLILLLFPLRALHRRSRLGLLITVCNVLIAPFGDIKFRTLYVGDVLTSTVKTLFDVEYTICYYVTGDWLLDDGKRCTAVNKLALPILSGLPLFLRLLQCLRRYKDTKQKANLGNAGKYTCACGVVIFGAINGYQSYPEPWTPFRCVWFIWLILSTLYSYTWDITMDWGLGKRSYKMLRKTLLFYPHIWVYFLLMFVNAAMRFSWTLYITPAEIDIGINPEFFVTILAVIEIYRRFQWSVFRVEYEQINNMESHKAHDLAPIPGSETALSDKFVDIGGSVNGTKLQSHFIEG